METTANALFDAGHRAPRGTYLCLATGMVHRLSRPMALPEGGPFRMVAPTPTLGGGEPPSYAAPFHGHRWPEDDSPPKAEEHTSLLNLLSAFRIATGGRL